MKIVIAQSVAILALAAAVFAPSAHADLTGGAILKGPGFAPVPADDGSYLSVVRQNPASAGFSDFALLFGGHKACMTPPDQVASVAPGFPALSAAVYDAAHREMC